MDSLMEKNIDYLSFISKFGTETIKNIGIAKRIEKHAKRFNITGEICAWYENMEDFYSDWCEKYNGHYSRSDARDIYDEGIIDGEFERINKFGILRYVV